MDDTELAACGLPEAIELIPDATVRYRAAVAWRAATTLIEAIDGWDRLMRNYWVAGDIDRARANELAGRVHTAVMQICDTGILPAGATPQSILDRFPPPPRGDLAAWHREQWPKVAGLRRMIEPQLRIITDMAVNAPGTLFAAAPSFAEGNGTQAPETDSRGDQNKWSAPDSPARWAKKFQVSPRTIKKYFSNQTIRNCKRSDRRYQVHLDDLPQASSEDERGRK